MSAETFAALQVEQVLRQCWEAMRYIECRYIIELQNKDNCNQ